MEGQWEGGKGSKFREVDMDLYRSNHDNIFSKKKEEIKEKISENPDDENSKDKK